MVTLAPFVAVDPGAAVHDTIGFLRIQGLQRLPLPLHYHGALRPTKVLEFYYPVILLAAAVVCVEGFTVAGRDRPEDETGDRTALSLVPLAVVGIAYLIGRPDEFHLAPLAPVLAVILACLAPLARFAVLRAVLAGALALVIIAGLERRAGQLLHPPAAAAVPGPAGDGVHTSPADARSLRRLMSPWAGSPARANRSSSPTPALTGSASATRCSTSCSVIPIRPATT